MLIVGGVVVAGGAYLLLRSKKKQWIFANQQGVVVYKGPSYATGLAKAGGVWVNHKWIPQSQLPSHHVSTP